jgi:hypothetical protein
MWASGLMRLMGDLVKKVVCYLVNEQSFFFPPSEVLVMEEEVVSNVTKEPGCCTKHQN